MRDDNLYLTDDSIPSIEYQWFILDQKNLPTKVADFLMENSTG